MNDEMGGSGNIGCGNGDLRQGSKYALIGL